MQDTQQSSADVREVQELLLAVMPGWHHFIARPFKQLFREDMSLEMYYCLQALHRQGDMLTMSELARLIHVPKQRMTRLVDQLSERGFVERVYDSTDRRITRLRVTQEALTYIDEFLSRDAGYYHDLLTRMSEQDRAAFRGALEEIQRVFDALPTEEFAPCHCREQEQKGGNPCSN